MFHLKGNLFLIFYLQGKDFWQKQNFSTFWNFSPACLTTGNEVAGTIPGISTNLNVDRSAKGTAQPETNMFLKGNV